MQIAEILNKLPENSKIIFKLQYMEELHCMITYENWRIESVFPLRTEYKEVVEQIGVMATAMHNKINQTKLIPAEFYALS